MTVTEDQLICTHPFEWCEIHPDGSVFLCCPAWLKRPIGNLLEHKIEPIWNSPTAREIRKSILNGSFHNCSKTRCPFFITQQDPVNRISAVQNTEVRAALETKQDRLDYLPKCLNLCFDHSCNLACPSCRTQKQQASGPELERVTAIADNVMEQLVPQAEEITLSGFGDPFGSPTYRQLLRQLNWMFEPPALRLHSNGQLWTEELWSQFPALHSVIREAEISIDAASATTYALNRPGGSFVQLTKNLEFLSRQKFPLTLSMVVQANNYREIPEFINWAERLNARVYFSQLVNWGTFRRKEYLCRAVHLPSHPEHGPFTAILRDNIDHPRVRANNLQRIITES